MTSKNFRAITASFSTLVAFAGVSGAAEVSPELTMKPLHGLSFDVGTERAVSYFTSENGTCRLVVTLAGEPDWNAPETFSAKRFEAAVQAGNATSYTANGKTLEFACQDAANAMAVRGVTEVAAKSAH